MTKEEASHFLAIEDGEEISDAYWRNLFLHKKYFLTNAIIYSVFEQKLHKMAKIAEAASIFGFQPPIRTSLITECFTKTDKMLDAFNEFNVLKSKYLQEIHRAESFQELEAYAKSYLQLNTDYISLWPNTGMEENRVKLSSEPDPVELLAALQVALTKGIITFQDLELLKKGNDVSNKHTYELLLKESMRLYLLKQKEMEWKKHSKG